MSYIPLARKYRPRQFHDLLGQEAVVKALSNGISLGREPHALIFTGVRGVGKTTVARLYAKALNCSIGTSPEPCDQCSSCIAIREGCHEDVLEVDGASNTGVDDVRDLQEFLSYAPQRSRFRVFIIDEVHMLSQSAFNALLKTLEELPSHVIFIFATTELAKVPSTILSRCQTFHLQCLSVELIQHRIAEILEIEKISFEPESLKLIAQEGHGSMRDALTFLDQVIAVSSEKISLDSLRGLISVADSGHILDFLEALQSKNAQMLVDIVSEWERVGLVLTNIIEECAINCRHAFVIRELGAESLAVAALSLEPEHKRRLNTLAKNSKALELNQLFRTLHQCRLELDGSMLDRFIVENYMFEWCFDPGLPCLEDILHKGESIPAADQSFKESMPAQGLNQASRISASEFKSSAKLPGSQPVLRSPLVSDKAPNLANISMPDSWKDLVDKWKERKPLEARMFEECFIVKYQKDEIILSVRQGSMVAAKLLQPDVTRLLKRQLSEFFGFSGSFIVVPKVKDDDAENLLTARVREQGENDAKIRESALTDTRTLDALSIFKGEVESVNVK